MSDIKLLPCPWCGSTKIKLWHSPFGVGGECRNCGGRSGTDDIDEDFKETRQEAAARWNRRADTEKSRAD